jgi:subtilisin-like proprotein convertase family protein
LLTILTALGAQSTAVEAQQGPASDAPQLRPLADTSSEPAWQPFIPEHIEECIAGSAGGYPCNRVDLLEVMPTGTIGGGNGNDLWGWTDPFDGREYALMGRSNGTAFIDITDPGNPIYLGNLPTSTGNSIWRDIKTYADHAFIVSDSNGNHGMQVFDLAELRSVVSPPVTFSETGHYSNFGSAHNIVIDEDSGYAFAVGVSSGTTTCSGGLHMIDISTPSATSGFPGGGVTIPANSPAVLPYPNEIVVSGVTGTTSHVRVEIEGFAHSWPRDVDVLLVGPGGQNVLLMSDTGGSFPGLTGIDILFDDAASPLPSTAFGSGAYRPTNLNDGEGDDAFPAPAPGGSYGTLLSVFDGVDSNGTWSLYVYDDTSTNDGGSIGGWTLSLQQESADFQATSSTLTVSAGSVKGEITIPVMGDMNAENDETFDIVLSNPFGATIVNGTGTGTILDDDSMPIFSDGFESGDTSAWDASFP